ncbi:hypothetical protein LCGC14_2859640, partial [marine sediment metagenome]
ITLEGLREGYRRVRVAGITIDKTRVTGGEPLLHPQFVEAMEIISETWNKDYSARTCVFSNGTLKLPKTKGWRYNLPSTDKSKQEWFRPSMLSPIDLGYSITNGVDRNCTMQIGCGRVFDAYGFAACVFSPPIGRLLGIDPYSSQPVLKGDPEICKHCPYSLPRKQMWRLFVEVRKSKRPPTKTFQEAMARAKNGLIKFTRFEDRKD